MKKEKLEDPYASVRKDIPKPGKVIKSMKDYDRKRKKNKILREIEEFHDEIDKRIQIL